MTSDATNLSYFGETEFGDLKIEIYLEEDPDQDELKNDAQIEEGRDILVVVKQDRDTFRCDLCPRSFLSAASLQEHKVLHSVPKPFVCKICKKSFRSKSSWSAHHLAMHKNEARYFCNFCPKRFYRKGKLDIHIKRHNKEKDVKCGQCSKSFIHLGELKQHMKLRHATERPYKCEMCRKAYASKYTLNMHAKSHLKEKTHMCEHCSLCYKSEYSLLNHQVMVHGLQGRFLCEVCGKHFMVESMYREHVIRHKDGRNVSCDECGDFFLYKNHLIRHKNSVHAVDLPFKCKECLRAFADENGFKRHFVHHDAARNHHPTPQNKPKIEVAPDDADYFGDDDFKCKVCSQELDTERRFKYHLLTHDEPKVYKCDVCDEEFDRGNLRRRHVSLHRGPTPNLCDRCGKRFKTTEKLRLHMARHSDERNYICDQCPKTFKNKLDLTKHRNIVHAADRPHMCRLCAKTFKLPSMLQQHLVSHDKERLYKCHLCPSSFKHNSNLYHHNTKMHGQSKVFKYASTTTFPIMEFELLEPVPDERPYKCDRCGKAFKYGNNFEIHKRKAHAAARAAEFPCGRCDMAFANDSDLANHSMSAHNQRPYNCPMCPKTYKLRVNLDAHIADVHNVELVEVDHEQDVKMEQIVIYDSENEHEELSDMDIYVKEELVGVQQI